MADKTPVPPRPLALITGASSGIGAAFAQRLAERGHDLVLVARRGDRLAQLGRDLGRAHGVTAHVAAHDLTEAGAVAALMARLAEGGLAADVLVNNAGFGTQGHFLDADLARELSMIDLNCRALTALTYAVARGMQQRGRGGAIIHTSSVGGFAPAPYFATYGATKAYILSFSEALACELAPHGILVQTLCPGATTTEFADVANFKGPLPKGMLETADQVVVAALRHLDRQRRKAAGSLLVSGLPNKAAVLVQRLLPRAAITALTAKLMRPAAGAPVTAAAPGRAANG